MLGIIVLLVMPLLVSFCDMDIFFSLEENSYMIDVLLIYLIWLYGMGWRLLESQLSVFELL